MKQPLFCNFSARAGSMGLPFTLKAAQGLAIYGAICLSLMTFGQNQGTENDPQTGEPGSLSLNDLFVDPSGTAGASVQPGDAIVPRKAWENDFDDADSPGDFPLRYWVRMTSSSDWPGEKFLDWNATSYEPKRPVPGEKIPRVFELAVRGGNNGIRLVDGVISAIPLTDYLVRLKVRTLENERARALVLARFLDERGDPIAGSTQQSLPIDTEGEWETIALTLTGQYPKATWIQIDLLLVQPDIWDARRLSPQAVRFEDMSARVQFDDLTVWRLPRIELQTSASNTILAPEKVRVHYNMQDMASRHLRAAIRLYDIRGNVVDETGFEIKQPALTGVWEPAITEFGWYRAELDLLERDEIAAQASTEFAYLPKARRDLKSDANPREFTTILEELPGERTNLALKTILSALGAGRVAIPIWGGELRETELRAAEARLTDTIKNALGENRAIDIMVGTLPDELAEILDTESNRVLNTLLTDPLHTPKYLESFLIRFGERADRWIIGGPFSEELAEGRDLREVFSVLDDLITRFVPRPIIELPYPGDFELPSRSTLNGTSTVDVEETPIANTAPPDNVTTSTAPMAVLANHEKSGRRNAPVVDHYLLRTLPGTIRPSGAKQFMATGSELLDQTSVLIESIDAEVYGQLGSMIDLAKRTILCKEAGARELAIMQPWNEIGRIRPRPAPQPSFPVWRTLREALAGRQPEGRLELARGIVATIFADADRTDGTIACWSESAENRMQTIRLYLGPGAVEQVDIFGNRVPIPFDGEKHLLTIGAEPTFLEGADIRLAIFRSSLDIDSNFVEAAAIRDPHHIVMRNPWPKQIEGTIRLTEPSSWQFQPRYLAFSMSADEELRIPVTLTIPMFETAGPREITANVAVKAIHDYVFDSVFAVELGHQSIVIRPTYTIVPDKDGKDDLVVTLEFTNRGADPFALRAFCVAPVESGFPYQTADVPMLKAGETIEQGFHFRDGADLLRGQSLRVGFRGIDSSDRLNLMLEID